MADLDGRTSATLRRHISLLPLSAFLKSPSLCRIAPSIRPRLSQELTSALHNPDVGIMPELMERHTVEVRCALERLEPGQADVVLARAVVRFACAFADRGTAARQKVINR